jgi:hypothetical protein
LILALASLELRGRIERVNASYELSQAPIGCFGCVEMFQKDPQDRAVRDVLEVTLT